MGGTLTRNSLVSVPDPIPTYMRKQQSHTKRHRDELLSLYVLYPIGRPVRATITLYPIGRPVRATITLYPIGRPVRATITLYPTYRET